MELIPVLLLGAFFLWLGWKLRISWKNFLFSLRRKRGTRGERNAVKILAKHGYEIVRSQVKIPGSIYVDGKRFDFDVRPDYEVERKGIRCFAEVKTGDAAKIKNRNTRRQLLEYTLLGGTDKVVLVDATTGTVSTIHFME